MHRHVLFSTNIGLDLKKKSTINFIYRQFLLSYYALICLVKLGSLAVRCGEGKLGIIHITILGSRVMAKGLSLQEPFLNMLRKDNTQVAIYLVNGIKLQGEIESFDQYVIILKSNISQMVYKHAISTIVPSKAMPPIHLEVASEEG